MTDTNDYLTKCQCSRTTSIAFARAHNGRCKVCVPPVITITASARIFTGNENRAADTKRTKPSLLKRVSLWLEKLGRAV